MPCPALAMPGLARQGMDSLNYILNLKISAQTKQNQTKTKTKTKTKTTQKLKQESEPVLRCCIGRIWVLSSPEQWWCTRHASMVLASHWYEHSNLGQFRTGIKPGTTRFESNLTSILPLGYEKYQWLFI